MTWTELLRRQTDTSYASADGLLDLLSCKQPFWKPATGENWMTTGQLPPHLPGACGVACKGFVTGGWGAPDGLDPNDPPTDGTLPLADAIPAIDRVAEAKRRLAQDRELASRMIHEAGEVDLAGRAVSAPWDPREITLGQRLLQMVTHRDIHKGQLFYYLKLRGLPVNTPHQWTD